MLKFFKKLRQRFIAEQKISNYILYALGEIVLVVIGILIALAINNRNEDSIRQNKEQVYLRGLQEEFEISQLKLEELIKFNRESYTAAMELLAIMDGRRNATEQELSELFVTAFAYDIFFNPNNSLLNEMINSGSLKDISSNSLRIALANWVATMDDISNQEHILDDQRNSTVDVFRREGHSIRTILDQTGMSQKLGIPDSESPMSNISILESIDFENNLMLFIVTSQATETEHYSPLMGNLESILDRIALEIKQ